MFDLTGLDVLMVIASRDFRDEEYREPAEALAHAKAGVIVACSSRNPSIGMFGYRVTPDLLLSEADVSKYAAVVFIGGSGAGEYFDSPVAHRVAQAAEAQGKILAAICIAPSILANAGALECKKATCYPSEKANLKAKGANVVGGGVVRDGKLITADGPQSAHHFARTLCEALSETER